MAQTVQDAGRSRIALLLQQKKLAALPPPAEGVTAYRGLDPRIAGVARAFTRCLYRLKLR